jgi:benzoyl-CoA 2,3-epoxidase subunit A
MPDQPKTYVQDAIRREGDCLLKDPATHVFICSLKGMEEGVDEAFADVCRDAPVNWSTLKAETQQSGRYQVETCCPRLAQSSGSGNG